MSSRPTTLSNTTRAPLRLNRYTDTRLRHRVEGAAVFLRWAKGWLDATQDMTLAGALDGLAHTKRVRRTARSLEGTFEEAAIALMLQQGVTHAEGAGYTADLHPGNERREWRSEALMSELVEQAVARAADRFPDLPRRQIRVMLTESMWGVYKAARLEWRSTALREIGVDPDEFTTTYPGAASIEVRGDATYVNQDSSSAVTDRRRTRR